MGNRGCKKTLHFGGTQVASKPIKRLELRGTVLAWYFGVRPSKLCNQNRLSTNS